MGLFSNNKKLCPICGSPTPRLLATVVDDQPLCKACAAKIDLPDGSLANMSIEAFRNYLDFYEENRPLREQFTQTEQFSFGFFSGGILLDTEHRLLRLKYGDGAFAFTAENFACFRIYEDGRLLMEGKTGSLDLYRSEVPAILKKLAPKVLTYLREKREYERFEELERMLEKNGDSSSTRRLRRSEPRFDEPAPVRQFELEIQLRHPYWGSFRQKISAPVFMHCLLYTSDAADDS